MADVPVHRVSLWLCERCMSGQVEGCETPRCELNIDRRGPLATDPPLSAFQAAKENEGATVASIERERDEFRAAHMAVVAERDAARADLEIDVHVLRAERDDAENDAECKACERDAARAENARLRKALEEIATLLGSDPTGEATGLIRNIVRAALATPPATAENLTSAGCSEAPATTGGGQAAKPATPVGRSRGYAVDAPDPYLANMADARREDARARAYAEGYDAATADVVAWLRAMSHDLGRTMDATRVAEMLVSDAHRGAAARAKGVKP